MDLLRNKIQIGNLSPTSDSIGDTPSSKLETLKFCKDSFLDCSHDLRIYAIRKVFECLKFERAYESKQVFKAFKIWISNDPEDWEVQMATSFTSNLQLDQ